MSRGMKKGLWLLVGVLLVGSTGIAQQPSLQQSIDFIRDYLQRVAGDNSEYGDQYTQSETTLRYEVGWAADHPCLLSITTRGRRRRRELNPSTPWRTENGWVRWSFSLSQLSADSIRTRPHRPPGGDAEESSANTVLQVNSDGRARAIRVECDGYFRCGGRLGSRDYIYLLFADQQTAARVGRAFRTAIDRCGEREAF